MYKYDLDRLKFYKNFFQKLDYDTLDSIDLILPTYDPILNSALTSVSNSKFDEIREEFEGMNEYDHITRSLNFNIDELDQPNRFTRDEKEFIKIIKKYK